ncbi:MAG: formylglycine-generating enzyme family protein [Verrucomicrobiota bacterium]|nr:formylglycine-generating enzyme family protein [Verrucomicrobiota bacterium]
MQWKWIIMAAVGWGARIGLAVEWCFIPFHVSRNEPVGGCELGRYEVTVEEFAAYLEEASIMDFPETAQIQPMTGGRYRIKPGMASQAVSEVTFLEAEAFSTWLSGLEGRVIRLPTEREWVWAARGGVEDAPYPWGWGGQIARLAQFNTKGPAQRVGRFPANGFGLADMAGNVYEWCVPPPEGKADGFPARGGAWSEWEPRRLHVENRQLFPPDYRGRDVGFRLLRESPE